MLLRTSIAVALMGVTSAQIDANTAQCQASLM
jgi:hypothetical protein